MCTFLSRIGDFYGFLVFALWLPSAECRMIRSVRSVARQSKRDDNRFNRFCSFFFIYFKRNWTNFRWDWNGGGTGLRRRGTKRGFGFVLRFAVCDTLVHWLVGISCLKRCRHEPMRSWWRPPGSPPNKKRGTPNKLSVSKNQIGQFNYWLNS